MKGWVFVSAAVLYSLVLGCGGSGSSGPRGKVCPADYNPLPVELSNTQKVDLDPASGQLAEHPGTFIYEGVEVYYFNSQNNVKIHVAEGRSGRNPKEYVKSIACVSGLKPEYENFSFKMTALTQLTVATDPTAPPTLDEVRDFEVRFEGLRIVHNFNVGDKDPFNNSPKKVYEGSVSAYAFYKMSPNDPVNFQVRSSVVEGPITKTVVVYLKRTPPQVTPTAQ